MVTTYIFRKKITFSADSENTTDLPRNGISSKEDFIKVIAIFLCFCGTSFIIFCLEGERERGGIA